MIGSRNNHGCDMRVKEIRAIYVKTSSKFLDGMKNSTK